jgi:outer membrane protein
MYKKGRKFLIIGLSTAFSWHLQAQTILDEYVSEGLKNNLVLKQRNVSLEKAIISLKEAKSLFLPSVNFNGSVMTAEGGRYTNLPIASLVNPVYSTLNQLTASNSFPQIQDQQINFLPKNYYDTYIRTSMPLVNSDIVYNKKIEQQKLHLQEFEVKVYERELVKNIKTAYFNYLSSQEAVKIYESALVLLNRNITVNQSLLRNGKSVPTALLRSQSELENVNAQLNDAKNQNKNATSYFNFLLNKEQITEITVDTTLFSNEILKSSAVIEADFQKREELQMLNKAKAISQTLVSMNKKFWIPKVSAFLDLGSQAVDFEISNKSRYYMLGLNATMPIYNGLRNKYKIQQAALDNQINDFNLKNVQKQLQLAVDISKNNLATSYQNYISAQQRLKSAESYFRLIDKGYNEGINSLIEFIDARNQLTSAKLQVNLNAYKIFVAYADFERESASYTFSK